MNFCKNYKHCFQPKEYISFGFYTSHAFYKNKYYCAVEDKLDPVTGERNSGQECVYKRYKDSQIISECPDYNEKITIKLLFKRFLNLFKKK